MRDECINPECHEKTTRVFCGSCFWALDDNTRRKLQIGATKTTRKPDDRRAARKYALVVSDALELLRGRNNGDGVAKEKAGTQESAGQETDGQEKAGKEKVESENNAEQPTA